MRRTEEILRWNWQTALSMIAVSLVGFLSFTWPFFASSDSAIGGGNNVPWLFAVLVGLLALVLLSQLSAGQFDAKTVAVLGVLAALGGALRVLSGGTAGLDPIFFMLIIGGRVLGRTGGFLLGAFSMVTGAFLTGGVGPWLPFQMMAAGWIAMGAALLPAVAPRFERWLLAGYGFVAGLAYGAIMNLWFWPFLGSSAPSGAGFSVHDALATQLQHYGLFYGLTSFGWDLPRGVLTAALVVVAYGPMQAALRRSLRRASFGAVPTFETPSSP